MPPPPRCVDRRPQPPCPGRSGSIEPITSVRWKNGDRTHSQQDEVQRQHQPQPASQQRQLVDGDRRTDRDGRQREQEKGDDENRAVGEEDPPQQRETLPTRGTARALRPALCGRWGGPRFFCGGRCGSQGPGEGRTVGDSPAEPGPGRGVGVVRARRPPVPLDARTRARPEGRREFSASPTSPRSRR